MSAWWTKVRGEVKRHDGRSPKVAALQSLSIERWAGNVPLEELGLYRRDPGKHPDAVNELPAMLEKAQKGRRQ